jgi:hypothetical protein
VQLDDDDGILKKKTKTDLIVRAADSTTNVTISKPTRRSIRIRQEKQEMAIQMSTEQFRELLRTYQGELTVNMKIFSHCTARYDGSRSATTVEEFVTTVSIYKQVEGITDENALTGLPLLLEWWNGVKTQASACNEAMTLIRRFPCFKAYFL